MAVERAREHGYLVAVASAGAVAIAATVAWAALTATRAWLAPPTLALLAGLTASSFVVLRNVVTFSWRGQRVALAPDEGLVLVALATLPPPLVVAFALPSMTAYQVVTRRPFLKGAFNVANLALSASLGVLAFLALRDLARLPALVAAVLSLVPYTITTHLLVSGVFARREGTGTLRVYRDRFRWRWIPNVAFGSAAAVAVLALWGLHPLAVLAIAPFALLAREYVRVEARAEREARTHKRLAEAARDLVGEPSAEAVAERVAAAAGELLRAGRVTIEMDDLAAPASWQVEGGGRPGSEALAESIVGREGLAIGRIVARPPSSTHEAMRDEDRDVLRTVAAAAGQAFENARALRELKRVEEERVANVAREKELERLRDLDDLKTRFLHMAAHDLGTPLTPIGLTLHRLKRSSLSSEDAKSVRILDRNFARLRSLVEDLLDAARLQSSRMVVERARVRLDPLAQDAVESFGDVAREKGVALAIECAGTPPVDADPNRLQQVLYNLISNAIKFTPAGGEVRVTTSTDGASVALRVRDSGAGLDEAQIARLFHPFTQVHDASERRGGTGLGLYVTKGIVELHGGTIACESEGRGLGATFTVVLPVASA